MQPETTRIEMACPINGKICKSGVRSDFEDPRSTCRWWTHVAGKDPQSEKVIDHFDCAVAWVPVVVLEASQMTRQGTATMQEFRNETHESFSKFNATAGKAAAALSDMAKVQRKMIEAGKPQNGDSQNGELPSNEGQNGHSD
jgi:hypothetical protein